MEETQVSPHGHIISCSPAELLLIRLTLCVRGFAALPPPNPPPLSPLFGSLVNLLQCDVLLAVEGAVLQWAMEPSGGGWTESMLQRVRLEL